MRRLPLFPDLRRRPDRPELMDLPDSDPRQLERTLEQFALVNMYLTRARHLLKRYVVRQMLMNPDRQYHMVDLGAGACELDVWLIEHCRRRGLKLRVSACDHDPRVTEFAMREYGDVEGLQILERDALAIADLAPFDFVFSNHLLHHLDEDNLRALFSALESFPEAAILFNDLRRSRLAYSAYYLLSSLIFRSGFARHDGLLSICKGFKGREMRDIISRATGCGFSTYRVLGKFPNRIVIWRPAATSK